MGPTAREIVHRALLRVEKDAAYSNIILNSCMKYSISDKDKGFITALFYGVLEKKLLLDYNIVRYSKLRIDRIEPEVLMALRMGMYQLLFCDSVPARAAVNETVKLCSSRASSYVNAVMRAAAAEGKILLPDKRKGKTKYFSIRYSCPESIVKLWRNSYGDELCEKILASLDGRPEIYARVNTLKTSADELAEMLRSEGVNAEKSSICESCIVLRNTGSVEEIEAGKKGLFHVQDLACQICCGVLDVSPGMTVTDACAAPGGKSFTLAEMMENKGVIFACDLYPHRLDLVRSGAERLGIDIIRTAAGDSASNENIPVSDRILCDVPCSGLGVLKRKPELRYKNDTGIDSLPEIQYSILNGCAAKLKSGGKMVYSTCTLNPAENGEVVRRFLDEHEDFERAAICLPDGIRREIDEPDNELTLFPGENMTDGFFISLIKRK